MGSLSGLAAVNQSDFLCCGPPNATSATPGKMRAIPGSYRIFSTHGDFTVPVSSGGIVVSARWMGGFPPTHRELRYSARRFIVLPPICCCWPHPMHVAGRVCGTGVMMSKAVCVVLIFAIPGFLGYQAALNVDRKEQRSRQTMENSATAGIWPAPPAAATSACQCSHAG